MHRREPVAMRPDSPELSKRDLCSIMYDQYEMNNLDFFMSTGSMGAIERNQQPQTSESKYVLK